jgi:hypothetical protein
MALSDDLHELLSDRYGDKVTEWESIVPGHKNRIDINATTVRLMLDMVRDYMTRDATVRAVEDHAGIGPHTWHAALTAALDAMTQDDGAVSTQEPRSATIGAEHDSSPVVYVQFQ